MKDPLEAERSRAESYRDRDADRVESAGDVARELVGFLWAATTGQRAREELAA